MTFLLSDIAPAQTIAEAASRFPLGMETIRFSIGSVLDNAEAELKNFQGEQKHMLDEKKISMHGPFLDLIPTSYDPAVRETARRRFQCAYDCAKKLGVRRIIYHSGFLPRPYGFGDWLAQSVSFWTEFLREKDDSIVICVENVFDPEPEPLAQLADAVGHPALGLCLDIGHANVMSGQPAEQWIDVFGSRTRHVHLHNNFGKQDTHSGFSSGSMDILNLLSRLQKSTPSFSAALEISDAAELSDSLGQLSAAGLL